MTRASWKPPNCAASLRRSSSSSNWRLHWRMGSITRPATGAQIHAFLTRLAGEAPELDPLFFQRLPAKSTA
jgi:hypothetical protein